MRVRQSISEGFKLSCSPGNAYNNLRFDCNSITLSRGLTGPDPSFEIGCQIPPAAISEEDLAPLQSDYDDWNDLSGHNSIASSDLIQPVVTAPVESGHKRYYEDDDNGRDVESEIAYPRYCPLISHTRMPNKDRAQSVAIPKTRKWHALQPSESKESEMVDAEDFEETKFFQSDEWGKDCCHMDER